MLPKQTQHSKTHDIFKDLKTVDLSHAFSFSSPTWTGEIGFETQMMKEVTRENNYHYRSYHVEMTQNIGTHIDSPLHFDPNGISVSQLDLANLVNIPLCIINVVDKAEKDVDYELSVEDINNYEAKYETVIPKGSLVVCYSSWDRHWIDPNRYRGVNGEDKGMHFPVFSLEAVKFLNEKREIAGIGIDTLSPETNLAFPIHCYILGKGKYIVENLTNLGRMPEFGGLVTVLPLKIKDLTESPVRVYGLHK